MTARTARQRAASRANGAKSRGPVTAEGKRRSSRNATRHGLAAGALIDDAAMTDMLSAFTAIANDGGAEAALLFARAAVRPGPDRRPRERPPQHLCPSL